MSYRIIIDTADDVDAATALACVDTVIRAGKISEAGGIPHYCWHTVFKTGIEVSVRRKRTSGSADSFYVRRSVSYVHTPDTH